MGREDAEDCTACKAKNTSPDSSLAATISHALYGTHREVSITACEACKSKCGHDPLERTLALPRTSLFSDLIMPSRAVSISSRSRFAVGYISLTSSFLSVACACPLSPPALLPPSLSFPSFLSLSRSFP
eukprot:2889992-Pleurochrysis_carterae.AAC.2